MTGLNPIILHPSKKKSEVVAFQFDKYDHIEANNLVYFVYCSISLLYEDLLIEYPQLYVGINIITLYADC